MTQNRHGHHIKGTSSEDDRPYREVILCDGYPECVSCFDDFTTVMQEMRDRGEYIHDPSYFYDSNDEGGRSERIGAPWQGLTGVH